MTISAATSVRATFNLVTLTVRKLGTGAGTVSRQDGGISCGTDCTENYPLDTVVTLTASPAPGSLFGRWNGGCTGTSPTCTVTMSTSKSVTATFTRRS